MQHWSRRFVMKSLGAAVFLAGHPVDMGISHRAMPVGKQTGTCIEHNDLPWALETRRGQFGFGPITPVSHFFVRNTL